MFLRFSPIRRKIIKFYTLTSKTPLWWMCWWGLLWGWKRRYKHATVNVINTKERRKRNLKHGFYLKRSKNMCIRYSQIKRKIIKFWTLTSKTPLWWMCQWRLFWCRRRNTKTEFKKPSTPESKLLYKLKL